MNVKARPLVLLTTAGLLLLLGSESRSQVGRPTLARWTDVYAALDINKDLAVTSADLSDLNSVVNKIISLCDRDQSADLSSAELSNAKEIIILADKDTDGRVTRAELENWLTDWRAKLAGTERISLKRVLETKPGKFSDHDLSNVIRAAQKIMKRFDTEDPKKLLTASELSPIAESLRDHDTDGTGVNARELTAWLLKWRKELAAEKENPQAKKDVLALEVIEDKPRVGTISLAALLARKDKPLTAFDLKNTPRAAKAILDRLDVDKNAVLSADEISDVVEPLGNADLDGDGVKRNELFKWLIAWRSQLE